MSIKIGIVDDKLVNRTAIINKIQSFHDLEICLIAVHGDDCLEQLKGLPLKKMPQVIFMDLEMPGLNGIQTIGIAHSIYPAIFFIVLTVFDDDDKIFEAIKAGAHGYLLKDENAISLHDAVINVVEHGGAPMSPAIARKTLKLLGQKDPAETKLKESLLETLLTGRECEVLMHVVNGYDAKRIAETIGLSTLTVRKHIANVYTKLHVNSKAQVISMAHKNNWVK